VIEAFEAALRVGNGRVEVQVVPDDSGGEAATNHDARTTIR
jgi:hypothetical protein